MNGNLKNLQSMLNSGDIDKNRWKMYFVDVPDTKVPTCEDCLKRKNRSCDEETTPLDCFLYGSMSQSAGVLLKDGNEMKLL